MATIFKTASFKLWQKLTKALPLGPILPNIIPAFRKKQKLIVLFCYNNYNHFQPIHKDSQLQLETEGDDLRISQNHFLLPAEHKEPVRC